jgi:hypothetical protein
MRAFFYVTSAMFEDVLTQRSGAVLIIYNVGYYPESRIDREIPKRQAKMSLGLPFKPVGIHGCFDDHRMKIVMSMAIAVANTFSRARFRMHHGTSPFFLICVVILAYSLAFSTVGTHMECMYELSTFGIPTSCFPVDDVTGECNSKSHTGWLQRRRRQEESTAEYTEHIVLPGRKDVLLGRGKSYQEHAGNVRYRHIIQTHKVNYEASRKFEKTVVAAIVIEIIKTDGGRFLKQDGESWVKVDDDTLRNKVSHDFRNLRCTDGTTSATQSRKETQPSRPREIGSPSPESLGVYTFAPDKRPRLNPILSGGPPQHFVQCVQPNGWTWSGFCGS